MDIRIKETGGRATLANWRTAPFSSWAFHHVREILPTAEIAADRDAPEPFHDVRATYRPSPSRERQAARRQSAGS